MEITNTFSFVSFFSKDRRDASLICKRVYTDSVGFWKASDETKKTGSETSNIIFGVLRLFASAVTIPTFVKRRSLLYETPQTIPYAELL